MYTLTGTTEWVRLYDGKVYKYYKAIHQLNEETGYADLVRTSGQVDTYLFKDLSYSDAASMVTGLEALFGAIT